MKHRLIPILVLLAVSISLWLASKPLGEQKETLEFEASVMEVQMLAGFSGSVIQTHFDPRWVASVLITNSKNSGFPPGEIVNLAIHSPTDTFDGEDPKGRKGSFSLLRTSVGGRVSYSRLKASLPKHEKI